VSSFFAPFIGLEEAFGTGFTSGSIADAILVAEQNNSSVFDFGVFAIDGIEVGNLAFDVFQGLFLISDPITGAIIHQGATTQALNDSVERSRLLGLVGPPGPQGLPGPPDVNAIATAVRNLVAQLLARQGTTGGAASPGAPDPLGERVLPGGTVNVPVVLGSTGDPTGQRRPPFPRDAQNSVEVARQIGLLIRQILAARAQQRANERIQERNSANLAAWAAFFAAQGGQQMPFGQAGFVGAGPLLGSGTGELLQALIGAGTGFLASKFGEQAGNAVAQTFPAAPGIPGLQGGGAFGGGGACPPLFRTGAPAGFSMRPVPWFPVQAPNGKWFFFGHLGTPSFSKLKGRRRHHHHARKR